MALISFIAAIFPIIILHEFAHFLVGKYLGAEPEEFSVGFGKQLFSFPWLGATFKVCLIPLGGYVKFKKMQFDIEFGEGDKKGEKIAPWKWFFISIAGPMSNFVLTFAIFFSFLVAAFSTIQSGVVSSASTNQVAVGEKVVVVNNSALSGFIKKTMFDGDKGNMFVKRGEDLVPLTLTDEEFKSQVVAPMGNNMSVVERVSNAAWGSTQMLGSAIVGTTEALAKLFTKDGYKSMMGPIGIAGEANKARESGWLQFLFLIASLSFAVGYFNMLPLTFLDGGRALLALLEEITKKSIKDKTLANLNVLGFGIIIVLMGMSFFSDIIRLMEK